MASAERRALRRLRGVLPWAWLAGAWGFGVVFMLAYGRTLLDSDMASEMVLASLLNEEGGLLSTSWHYSTELRVFCQQILFKLGLWVFPRNWHAARTLAQGLLSALTAVSCLYFARGASLRRSAPWIAGVLLLPVGFWQMFHCVFGGFYYVHMIFVMLSMGLVLRLADPCAPRLRTAVRALALAVVCFAAGLNGVRILMNLYAPLLVAAAVLLAWRVLHAPLGPKPMSLPQLRLMAAAVGAAVCSAGGYLVNSRFLALSHHFSDQSQREWTTLDLGRLLNAWSDFLCLFGFPGDDQAIELTGTVSLFSIEGILGALGLLLAAALVAAMAHLVIRRRLLCFEHSALVCTLAACLAVDGAIFAFTNDMVGINGSYWLPVLPLAFAALAAEIETMPLRAGHLRCGAAVALAACVVGVSVGTARTFVKQPPRGDPHLVTVCDWLVENGYTQGYASFWYANVMTELSDGVIEMWDVDDLSRMNTHYWLQEYDHSQPPQGPVFLIADPSVNTNDLPYLDLVDIVYEDDCGFRILAAPDAALLLAAVEESRGG